MHRFLFPFLSCLLLWSCGISRLMNKGEIVQTNFQKIIPFDYYKKHIYVEVIVNERPLRFLLDTGAPNVIDATIAAELQLPVLSSNNVSDSQNQRQKLEYMKADVQIGGIKIENSTIIAADFSFKGCLDFDGLLGSNFMRHFNWEIDYEKKEIRVYEQMTPPPSYTKTQLSFQTKNQYTPLIEHLHFDSVYFKNVTMDTGSSGHLSLSRKNIPAIQEQNHTYRYGSTSRGLYGFHIDTSYYIKIQQLYLNDLLIDSSLALSNYYTGNLIGNDFWDNYGKIFIDWGKNQLCLPEYLAQTTLSFPKTQLLLRYDDYNDQLLVAAIYQQATAAIQDLTLNDQVIKFNELNTEKITDYCSFKKAQEAATIIHLKVRKSDGTMLAIELTKEQVSW